MNATGLCIMLASVVAGESPPVEIHVGSKAFTESAILGEMAAQLGRKEGFQVEHHETMGGTGIVWNRLLSGGIDVYPDYTGTVARDTLHDPSLRAENELRQALAEFDILMTRPLGFENSYEIGMREDVAASMNIQSISDLARFPDLDFGFSPEFVDREDGWRGLRARYGLPHSNVRSMEHNVCYRSLASGDIHAMEIYATDAKVKVFNIRILKDDLDFFPQYEAVFLYRAELAQRAPAFIDAIRELEGRIDHDAMLEMNVQVDVHQQTPAKAANDFLRRTISADVPLAEPSLIERVLRYTWDHLFLVVTSLAAAICVSVPLGVLAAKRPATGQVILSAAEIVQTIPGLALLILLMYVLQTTGLPNTGSLPAVVALFLYSLLPILRNTYTGIRSIPLSVRESAEALGLTPWAQLWKIELPLASPLILAGIKTTAVINVGYATLGGLIGAGGYGEPISQALYRMYLPKMLEGAIPAAILALSVKWGFELSERFVVPKGLRLKPSA